ncbi:hypothetical protein JNUCC0626_46190 [Lentzea sp. JNUCC 0626]|uniref:hypothetical protein n=1 Tax=Lentzea sp. JNUCC 0626 TaxID=3367513 RepID=UPI003747FFE2
MRMAFALVGMLAMFVAAVGVLFFGVLGFTPTSTCSGACQAPLLITLVGTVVIGLAATFATWFRAVREPRAYCPYLGAVLMVMLFFVSLSIAEAVR